MKQYKTLKEFIEKKLQSEKNWKTTCIILAIAFVATIFLGCIFNIIVNILFVMWCIFVALWVCFVIYIQCKRPILINQRWLKAKGWENIADDVDLENPTFKKAQICCGSRALVLKKEGLILPYSEMVWGYAHETRINGIKVSKVFHVHTRDGKTYIFALTPEEFVILIKFFVVKNSPDFILGYGKEQKAKYKQIIREKKRKSKV